MLFTTPEDRIFIHYLTGEYTEDLQSLYSQVDWNRIIALYPASYLCYLPNLPPAIKGRMKALALECFVKNQKRLYLIRTLANMAQTHSIPLLFVKGAAEIARNSANNVYITSRTMADIDVICRNEHLEALHRLLQQNGHVFYDYGLSEVFNSDKSKLNLYLIKKTGQFVYNFGSPTDVIELHCNVTNETDLGSYPPDFIELLWNKADSVLLEGISITIPSLEHRVTHCLCHAASPKNNIFFPEGQIRKKSQTLRNYSNAVLDREQLRFLCQMQLMLSNTNGLNEIEVQELLARVHNPLLKDYTALVSHYLKTFRCKDVSMKNLIDARKENIRTHMFSDYIRYRTIALLRKICKRKAKTMGNWLLLRMINRFI